jgi:hypothetical protein
MSSDGFSTQEKSNLLIKKFFGKPSTSDSLQFFQEPSIASKASVYTANIWAQSDDIPATAPADLQSYSGNDDEGNTVVGSLVGKTSGTNAIIKKYIKVELEHISGSSNRAYQAPANSGDRCLKDAIPFNTDASGTYLYTLHKNNGSTVINFGESEWVVDTDAGVLTFYDAAPSGVSSSDPPKITFYRYIGTKGIGSSSSIEFGTNKYKMEYKSADDSVVIYRYESGSWVSKHIFSD